jgi:hypothetical protein
MLQRPKAKVKKETVDVASHKGSCEGVKLEDHGAVKAERKYKRKHVAAKAEIEMLQRKIRKLKKLQKVTSTDCNSSDSSSDDSCASIA